MQEEVFSELITDHQRVIYKVCHLYADTPADVEDLFQEIVLNAWRSRESYAGRAAIQSWLYKVALNTAITQLRKIKRRSEHERHLEDIQAQLASVKSADADEQLQVMYAAVKRLGKIEKALVALYLEGYSYREISGVMGISENYVGVQLNRIKQKLRRMTGGDGDGS